MIKKTPLLNFIIFSVSLRHHVSTKIFVEYILKYLFVSFDLFWQQKQSPEVLCKNGILTNVANFTGKNLHSSLFVIKLQAF